MMTFHERFKTPDFIGQNARKKYFKKTLALTVGHGVALNQDENDIQDNAKRVGESSQVREF